MTRIYTTGSLNVLRSAKIPENLVKEVREDYENVVSEVDSNSYDLILTKDLEPLVESNGNLKVKVTDSSVLIGYYSHNGWFSVCSHNSDRGWYDDIDNKEVYFDAPLMMRDFSNIQKYEDDEEMAENEFFGDDGEKWIKWRENESILS